jgi:adenosine kinase
MDQAYNGHISDIKETISYATISPNNPRAMIEQAQELFNKKIPFFFDPGQQIFIMQSEQIRTLFDLADFFILNDYEFEIFQEKLAFSLGDIIQTGKKIIVTKGEKGSTIIDQS